MSHLDFCKAYLLTQSQRPENHNALEDSTATSYQGKERRVPTTNRKATGEVA